MRGFADRRRRGRKNEGRIIGRRLFTDGVEPVAYEDGDGRQYVVGPDGEGVYGVWLLPVDEPRIVPASGRA